MAITHFGPRQTINRTKKHTSQPSRPTCLKPKSIDELSKFIDCMQLMHSEIIEEISDLSTIEAIGHELYDRVKQLQKEGLL